MATLARVLAAGLVPLLFMAGAAVDGLPPGAAASTGAYRIQLMDSGVRADLQSLGISLKLDYGAFGIVHLSDDRLAALEARGIPALPEDLHSINLDGFHFDTRVGEPNIPVGLRAEPPTPGSVASVLIQFEGPIRPEWRDSVRDAGATIIDYIPANAFLVRAPAERLDDLAGLPHVQWTGPYHPAYKVRPSLVGISSPAPVEILMFPGAPLSPVLSELDAASIHQAYEGPRLSLVVATVSWEEVQSIARLPGVYYVEPYYETLPSNYRAQAVQTTGLPPDAWGSRKLWDAGLNGTGQIIAVADSGLDYDHVFFRESAAETVKDGGDIYNVTDLTRRKVVRYLVMSNYTGVDPLTDPWAWKDSRYTQVSGNLTSGHGTMSSGVLAGNDDGIGSSDNDGIAKGAKLILEDIGTVCRNPAHFNWWDDCLSYIPSDYADLFGAAYDEGARIHSNSWGRTNSNYDIRARMVDEWMWNHTDSFIVFSNGNGGSCAPLKHGVGSPATAKSAYSSGMSQTYPNEDNVSCQSSPGPTGDGRMKPTGIAVGSGKISRSSGDPWDNASTTWEGGFGGTSYSAPVHAGLAAIVRQYFMEGWYPAGEPRPADAFVPSGALLKAMLAAGSRRMMGNYSDMMNESIYPNNAQGWGRVVLDDAIYFRGEARRIEVRDASPGIPSGGGIESISVDVVNPSEPLRIILAWSDYPGAVNADPALVNNLNLVAIAPDGKEYKGNVYYNFSEASPGESKPDAGIYDQRNTVEGVLVNTPAVGTWMISVFGGNVPMGPQPYALVVAGGLGPYPPVTVDPPTGLTAELIGTNLTDVQLSWTLSADDPFIVDHYAVYVSTEYDPARANHTLLALVPAGSTSYTHVGAGYANSSNFFYYVQANTSLGDTAQSAEQAAKFVRPLAAGMQLVSVPLEVQDWSLSRVLQTVAGQYEAAWAYRPGTRDPWRGDWEVKNTSSLTSLDKANGFWIRMMVAGEMAVAGAVPQATNLALVDGWNLVGYPSFVDRTVADALAGLPVEAVEGYDDAAGPYFLRALSPGDVLRAGDAYWIQVSASIVWTVLN
jgi:hypothetical protein